MKLTAARFFRGASLCMLLLLLAVSSQMIYAQGTAETQPRPRIAVTIISVKPDMVTDFENMVKNEVNPALIKGGAQWRNVWRTATFGDAFEYAIVAPLDNFAQYDSPGPLEKGLGKEGFAAWLAKAGRMVNSVRVYALEERPDLSHTPKMAGPPKLAVVSYFHVAPGRNMDYENYVKNDLLPVVKQSGIPGFLVYQTLLGGDPNEYITLGLHDNYAELEKGPPVRRVLGREKENEVYRKLAPGTVVSVERTVIRYVPELSIRPATPPSN